MLPSRRRRERETAEREAVGESLWTSTFEKSARVRLAAVWENFENQLESDWHPGGFGEFVSTVLRVDGGWDLDPRVLPDHLRRASDELVQDMLGAVYIVIEHVSGTTSTASEFADSANSVLREHRIAFKFVEGELVPFSSDELLQEVVEPALRLLVGSKFAAAHGAYMDALKEIGDGKPGDAITDAGTALQEILSALGCEGNALGPLIKSAKKQGILGGHDERLTKGIEEIAHWASADRNTTGDAHKHSKATIADAWLMVHVVGALIVRLADPAPRSDPD